MNRFFRALAAAAAVFLAACATAQPRPATPRPLTVLVSIDGFRPDYLERGVTPTLKALAAEGASAGMRPSFPSKTFPNHYTLVTGLRPDRNGIVDNNMFDPTIGPEQFTLAARAVNTDPRWWNQAEPIWVSAERAGVRTATMFWPGSEVAIRGVRPSHWMTFNPGMPAYARVDRALSWLDEPAAERPQLITLYFNDVDDAGHAAGPDSPQVNAAAGKVDAAIARLEAGLKARGVVANLVVVSDHGMAPTSRERRIFADDYVALADIKTVTMGAFMSLNPAPGRTAAVETALLGAHPHFQCWRKAQIPARYHYGTNPRIPAIFCLPETGWEITTRSYRGRADGGDHGFDPFSPEMRATFIAAGPAFRRGVRLRDFDNVDVYPLLAKLLGVAPQPNDGRLSDIDGALRP